MAITSQCACCGGDAPGPLEWGWCDGCAAAGCVRLQTDAEGGEVRRGQCCPLVTELNDAAAARSAAAGTRSGP